MSADDDRQLIKFGRMAGALAFQEEVDHLQDMRGN